MKVSVIVSDVNEQGMILACVHMLCNQDFDDYEVILPDYGLFKKENFVILKDFEKQFPHLKILRLNSTNRCVLVNEAVKVAKGDVLLFLESHCIVGRDWVRKYVGLFKDKKVDIALGSVNTIPTRNPIGRAEEAMRLRIVQNNSSRGTDVTYFDFHNSAMRKKCFVDSGGLSERLPLLGEFELGARIHQKGFTIHQFPESVVWHANTTAFRKYAEVIGFQGRDKVRIILMHGRDFLLKYFPTSQSLSLLPWLKLFRIPCLILVKCIMYFGMFGFYVGKVFKMQGVCNSYFYIFAKASFWRGILVGLKEYPLFR